MRSRRKMTVEALEDRRMLATFTVSNLIDGAVVAAGDLPGSLRQAIFDANNTAGDDEIVFNGTVGTIALSAGELAITGPLDIAGPGQSELTIDAGDGMNGVFGDGDGWRIFNIDDGNSAITIDVTIRGLTLTGGDVKDAAAQMTNEVGEGGGAILTRENLTVIDSTISGNSVLRDDTGVYSSGGTGGGGISNRGGELVVSGCTLMGNTCLSYGSYGFDGSEPIGSGGGIYSRDGSLTVMDSTITGNSANNQGGGIASWYGDLTVVDSTISGNSAIGFFDLGMYGVQAIGAGGGISSFTSSGPARSIHIENCEIVDNSSNSRGGGIELGAGLGTLNTLVTGSNISHNTAGSTGGGIRNTSADVTIVDSTLNMNSARSGGGIYSSGGSASLTISNATISNNSATSGSGGGINGVVDISDSTVTNNTATSRGGGISGSGSVTRSKILNNSSGGRGGGINSAASLQITDSTIDGNSTTGDAANGGGVFLSTGWLRISGSTISNNFTTGANSHGGGIFNGTDISGHPTLISNSTISGNSTADGRGGGVYILEWAEIHNSTITNNTASVGLGSGVAILGNSVVQRITLDTTIVAGNTNEDLAVVGGTTNRFESAGYNFIGTGNLYSGANNAVDVFNQPGDTTGVMDPMLGPLQDNGGLTFTHALLPGSQAIDMGNPGFTSPPDFDQRGAGFDRVVGGRIDIGAFEVQGTATLAGDFDGDGDIDGRDFLAWQRGQSPTPLSSGDLSDWHENYGSSGLSAVSAPLVAEEAETENEITSRHVSFWIDSAVERETVTATVADEDVEFIGSVDRAFDELSTVPMRSVRGFGEMVARRGAARAATLMVFEKAL